MTERGLSFGAVASLYDEHRPGYPEDLISDVVSLLPGRRVIEVGAGTGKATAALLHHRLDLTCIEPDPAMAAILVARYPVPAVRVSFEEWAPDEPFDGLVAAQSWHWTDPATRWDKAAAATRPGGLIALFWNNHAPSDRPVDHRLHEAYEAFGIPVDERPIPGLPDGTSANGEEDAWPGNDLAEHDAFEYLGRRCYPWADTYSAARYAAYLNTTSHHRMLEDHQRERLTAAVVDIVDRHGGSFELVRRTDLYLARRAA